MADWWARRNADGVVAVMLPDEGFRYQDAVYDDAWLAEKGFAPQGPPADPMEWDHPRVGGDR